jgi:hypothetical protein
MRREQFWQLALALAAEEDVPQIGKIIAPGVAATAADGLPDLEGLLAALVDEDDGVRAAAEDVLRHVVGARILDGSERAIPHDLLALWAAFAERLSDLLRDQTTYPLRNLLWVLGKNVERLEGDALRAAGTGSRRLLDFAWAAETYDPFLVRAGIEAVVRTYASDPSASEETLRRVLEPERLVEHGFTEMPELAGEVARLAPSAPALVADVYAAAFEFEEKSDETTQMRGGVLGLTSRRSQDFQMARYRLGEDFADFLATDPAHAVSALDRVVMAYAAHRTGLGSRAALVVIQRDPRIEIRPDGSYLWDTGSRYHDDEIKMLDSFEGWARSRAAEGAGGDVVDLLTREQRAACIWRRALQVASETPEAFAEALVPLIAAKDALLSIDLSTHIGQYLSAGFTALSEDARTRIEKAIMALPETSEDTPDEEEAGRLEPGKARDRLLGCLAPEAVTTSKAAERIDRIVARDSVPPNEPPFSLGEFRSLDYGEHEILREQGVDVDAEPNRRLRELDEPVRLFAERHQNEAPTVEEARQVEEAVRELWLGVQSSSEDGVAEPLANRAWGHLSEAAEAISRRHDLPTDDPLIDLVRTILLASATHPLPTPREDTEQFDHRPSWSPPAPRIEAAGGLICLASHETGARPEILAAIEELSRDADAAVRYHVARRLHLLRQSAPDLMWLVANRIADEDTSTAVVAALVSDLPRIALGAYDRVEPIVRQVFAGALDERPGTEKLREMCIEVMTDLFVWRGDETARTFLEEKAIAHISERTRDSSHIVHRIREALTYGQAEPAENAHTEIRQRAIAIAATLLDAATPAFAKVNASLNARGQVQVPEEDPELAHAKALYAILHGLASDLYFASGAFEEKQNRAPSIDGAQRERLYRESADLLDALGTLGIPPITHHVLETLDVFIPFDPKGVFLRINDVVHAGQAGAYQMDSLGIDLFVRLIERYLAEHRTLLQADEECRSALIAMLDIFVRAGWPQARQLTYGLQDIYR